MLPIKKSDKEPKWKPRKRKELTSLLIPTTEIYVRKLYRFPSVHIKTYPKCTQQLCHHIPSDCILLRLRDSTSWAVVWVWGWSRGGNEMDETSEQMEKVISINHSVSRIFAIKSEIFLTFFLLVYIYLYSIVFWREIDQQQQKISVSTAILLLNITYVYM